MLFDLFEKFFSHDIEAKFYVKNKSLLERIARLEKEVFSKNIELEKAVKKYEEFEQSINDEKKNQNIQERQVEIYDKNLREIKKENDLLKEKVALMESKCIELLPAIKYPYKIFIDKLFVPTKFKDLLSEFSTANVKFISDIDGSNTNLLSEEARKILENFYNGICEFEIKLVGVKGERVSRVFSKYRKFCAHLQAGYIEFMSELKDYNFYQLIEYGFKSEQIKEIIQISEEYFRECTKI
ncbi:MAG: hypothetical protein ACRCSK_08335 [Fusobacteriaceae bacterium]